jgi:hypothetical protein
MSGLGEWRSRAEYDAWCIKNMKAMNRLAGSDPQEWERQAQKIEDFLKRMQKADLADG